MKKLAVVVIALAIAATLYAADKKGDKVSKSFAPQYTTDNQLIRPADYRQWVYVSSGLGMNYAPGVAANNAPGFTNVFVDPESYKAFMSTGKWPDKTVFALEIYSSASHGSINKQGRFQDAFLALEAEVKDESKGADTWAYYGFGVDGQTAKPFPRSACWQCHEDNAAVEHSFLQFYPAFIDVALAKGTVKPSIYIAPNITRLVAAIVQQGWATGELLLEGSKKQDPQAEILQESNLNSAAYLLLQKKETTAAVALFSRIVAEHPLSANAYDSLADGYAATGNKQLELETAQKELAAAPNDPALNDAQKKQLIDIANKRIAALKDSKI
jgi:tetratricopeptide (TPR) repeat protein